MANRCITRCCQMRTKSDVKLRENNDKNTKLFEERISWLFNTRVGSSGFWHRSITAPGCVFLPLQIQIKIKDTDDIRQWSIRLQTFQSHCSTWFYRMKVWMYRDWPHRHFHYKFQPITISHWKQVEVNIGWFLNNKKINNFRFDH